MNDILDFLLLVPTERWGLIIFYFDASREIDIASLSRINELDLLRILFSSNESTLTAEEVTTLAASEDIALEAERSHLRL